uniref:Reverse transcriptase/retrotransposon-derived protein RNase H-like domain-containing protein n=1 Tax=Lactuca sativa TaxID=4236 RepID=A0A9R1WK66_LACSA|nr:hypothetical protein LSAT_V11C100041720 [Lactuca sativa]
MNIVPGSALVRQKKGGRRAIGAKQSTRKEAIFETWITKPVMVKKHDRSWRMCIDYSNLNNTIPSSSDAHGRRRENNLPHRLQHILLPKKMSFSLKNAGAMYQRLKDKIFIDQIGRNVVVYVIDMVIKIRDVASVLRDIEETFRTLAHAHMKQTQESTPLGNSFDLKTPHNINGVQEINERLTSLGGCIAGSAEKALPLFHTLKGCVDKNKFKWMEVADKALQSLKEGLHRLPVMASQLPGETLQVYLAASDEAISSKQKKQLSIHFVRRELQNPEINYPILEKLVLMLILQRPEKSRGLAKWAIELGEHDIKYRTWINIKSKALADSLVEILDMLRNVTTIVAIDPAEPEARKYIWKLHTDGAVSKEGFRAGLILKNPSGDEIMYTLRFNFQVSNNEAEYESLPTRRPSPSTRGWSETAFGPQRLYSHYQIGQ